MSNKTLNTFLIDVGVNTEIGKKEKLWKAKSNKIEINKCMLNCTVINQ